MTIASLSGCAPAFTTTTNADVRVPENLRRDVRIQKSIDQAYANIATYAGECQPLGNVVLSPDRTKITVSDTSFGPQFRSVYMVIDIQAMGQNAVDFKGYAYYDSSMWKGRIDNVLNAINDPKKCA
ncbi:hypothetical protein [Cupriavidus campinensis]|uniref:Lipoprotein n=1 Tax=Cupriavidus campinensis TaxID=151783 RepID=A0ABY3ESH8_9BURK|nr:hypothetical protein [Cupriavidus campinensis]TSP13929.1 hypothetical protein FGG12_05485 [Cupriavidus campinensis]